MTPAPDAGDSPGSRRRRRSVETGHHDASEGPVEAAPLRLITLAMTVLGALALLAASAAGQGFSLAVTLLLALVLAWSWPSFSGSLTPRATAVVLAFSAVTIVLSALRDDLRWVAAAVALGVVLSFFAALRRTAGREGLVLSLLSAFAGLALIASGTTAVSPVATAHGRALVLVAMAAVVAAMVADLFVGVVRHSAVLAAVAVIMGVCAANAVGFRSSGTAAPGVVTMVVVGAGAAALSWAFRRVLAFQPGTGTLQGQVGAGAGSLLVVGAVISLANVVS